LNVPQKNRPHSAEINEFYNKVLNRVVSLSPSEAKALLRRAEAYFRDELEGEALEVGLLLLETIKKDYKWYVEAG